MFDIWIIFYHILLDKVQVTTQSKLPNKNIYTYILEDLLYARENRYDQFI